MARRMMARMTDHELGGLVQAGRAIEDRLAAEGQLPLLNDDVAALDAGRQARDVLVARHHKLAVYLARRWTAAGVELDDLAQAGLLGLTRAIEVWDPSRGVPLSAWARRRIIQAVGRAADQAKGTTEARRARLRTVRETETALEATLGRAPTEAETAAELGWPVARVAATTVRTVNVPLDGPPGRGADSERTLADRLAAPDDPAAAAEYGIEAGAVHRMLALLPADERQLLVLLYGLDGAEPVSVAEAARRLGVSRDAIHVAACRARARLRHPRYQARWRAA